MLAGVRELIYSMDKCFETVGPWLGLLSEFKSRRVNSRARTREQCRTTLHNWGRRLPFWPCRFLLAHTLTCHLGRLSRSIAGRQWPTWSWVKRPCLATCMTTQFAAPFVGERSSIREILAMWLCSVDFVLRSISGGMVLAHGRGAEGHPGTAH